MSLACTQGPPWAEPRHTLPASEGAERGHSQQREQEQCLPVRNADDSRRLRECPSAFRLKAVSKQTSGSAATDRTEYRTPRQLSYEVQTGRSPLLRATRN